ncbi:MAG: UDP-N-acetylmuramate dehydrogenase [bacterium]
MIDIEKQLQEVVGLVVRKDELMSLHTTLAIGGPCEFMLGVSNTKMLKHVLSIAKQYQVPFMVLGNGSNILVRDGGIPGFVIRLVGEFMEIDVESTTIRAGAGAILGEIVNCATSNGIGGLEFLAGIPGTLGGAVATNAGAKDLWISHRLKQVRVINDTLEEIVMKPDALSFGYRSSGIPESWIVTEATISGHACDVESARSEVQKYLDMRRRTQPIGERTAGCVFKNPPGDAAGRLIEKAGFKGLRKGAAQVSTIHANWIVNTGGATAREVLDLINEMRSRVKSLFNIDLDLEIRIIGKDWR